MDYTHLSTRNEIKNGTEVSFDDAKKSSAHKAQQSKPKVSQQMDGLNGYFSSARQNCREAFEDCFRDHVAPCIVADFFDLPGSPFYSEANATRALKHEIVRALSMPYNEIEPYSPRELAYALQFDVRGSVAPLPAESMRGCDLLNVVVPLINGSISRTNLDDQYPTHEELKLMSDHRCAAKSCSKLRTTAQVWSYMSSVSKTWDLNGLGLNWGQGLSGFGSGAYQPEAPRLRGSFSFPGVV